MNYLIEVVGSNVSREVVGSIKDATGVAEAMLSEGYIVNIIPTPLPVTASRASAATAYSKVAQMDLFRTPFKLVS